METGQVQHVQSTKVGKKTEAHSILNLISTIFMVIVTVAIVLILWQWNDKLSKFTTSINLLSYGVSAMLLWIGADKDSRATKSAMILGLGFIVLGAVNLAYDMTKVVSYRVMWWVNFILGVVTVGAGVGVMYLKDSAVIKKQAAANADLHAILGETGKKGKKHAKSSASSDASSVSSKASQSTASV